MLEESPSDTPQAYLHGYSNILPGLESALEGHAKGEFLEVTLSPEQGYGPRIDSSIQRIPLKHIKDKGKLKKGQIVSINTDRGVRQVSVMKVGRFVVDVDTNHPFAGLTLDFKIDIQDVRVATEEELSHGHAHGKGGHHH